MAERYGAGHERYGDWRSLELAIKDAAKKAARQAGPGISAASIDAQIRQARFDRFLCRVFAEGEQSEWLLKGGMSMLARVPRSRTTKDVDLAALHASDLAEAERALTALVEVDLEDHLTFRLIRSTPTGLGENQPGVATRRYSFACIDADHDTQVDTVVVDVVVGPPPVGRPEVVEPANRLYLRRPLITFPYLLYPVVDQIADKVCATMDTQYPGGKRSSRVKDLVRPGRDRPHADRRPGRAPSSDRLQARTQWHRAVRALRRSRRMGPYLSRDRGRRRGGRVAPGADGGRPCGVLRRSGARQDCEPGRLGPACAGLDSGHDRSGCGPG